MIAYTSPLAGTMEPSIVVKSEDPQAKTRRAKTARRVIAEFGDQLPNATLLCFFDDVDSESVKAEIGKANRGFYLPLTASGPTLPDYVAQHIFFDDPATFCRERIVDHLIYLHGSTSSDEIGMSYTFAHELRHFVQWGRMPLVYASGIFLVQLLRYWPVERSDSLGLKLWADLPHERDARIVGKHVVEKLFDQQRIGDFIEQKIGNPVNEADKADWEFIRGIASSDTYDVDLETRRLFQRMAPYRNDCAEVLQRVVEHIPQLRHVDLNVLFG